MKVLLLQPPVRDFYDTDIRLQPIGLAYLKAAVDKHLSAVRVLIEDYHAGWGRRTIPLPPEFAFLKPFYGAEDKSPFSTFHHFYHFGADFETLAKEVAAEKPDLVGISSLFSAYHREVLATAAAIREKYDVPIFIGGSHATAMPEMMLAHPAIDFVIRGEGERPLVEFLKVWLKKGDSPLLREKGTVPFLKVPNLGYKKNGKIVLNPCAENYPLEELPWPDLSSLPKGRYLFEGKPLCFILTSRGCPYRCAFCSVRTIFGAHYRRRSNKSISDEIKTRYAQGYRVFDLEDDNLTFDRKAAIELFSCLIRQFPRKDITLTAMNGICYWNLDPELLALMRQAGFTRINLSLVTANMPVSRKVRRPLDLKKYRTVVSTARKLGFKVVSYQILGLPGESVSGMIRTLVMNAKLPVLLGASPFYLTPSSPFAQELRGDAPEPFLARLTALGNAPDNDPAAVYTLFVTVRILNFLKGLSLPKDAPLKNALRNGQRKDPRSAVGVAILKKLLLGKGFFSATSRGFAPQPRFQTELFFKVWKKLDIIVTQEGKTIRLK